MHFKQWFKGRKVPPDHITECFELMKIYESK
jgi:hypothetical protein